MGFLLSRTRKALMASLVLALGDWSIERLWLYLLAGVMLVLVGLQLGLFWVIMRVLEELQQRRMQSSATPGSGA